MLLLIYQLTFNCRGRNKLNGFVSKQTDFGDKDNIFDKVFCQKLTDGNIELGLDELGGISQWESGKTYKVDSIVVYSDIIYKCKNENSDTIFNENNWTVLGDSSKVQSWKSAENYEPFQLLEDNENIDIDMLFDDILYFKIGEVFLLLLSFLFKYNY